MAAPRVRRWRLWGQELQAALIGKGVERSFAWFGRNRRLIKDFERFIESATAWLFLASVQQITRRLANLSSQTASS